VVIFISISSQFGGQVPESGSTWFWSQVVIDTDFS